MKKIITLVLICAMALSMVACGGKKESSNNTPGDSSNSPVDVNPVELLFFPKTSADASAYATIKVSADVKMDDESAWLGLCPAGKDYITEAEADDADVIWFGLEGRADGDPYVFSCDFESVADGTYALVVATSDNAEVGYVVIQLSMTKAGKELKFDFTNAKLNERPAK